MTKSKFGYRKNSLPAPREARAYMEAVKKHPLLTREGEQALATEIQRTGDPKLVNDFVNANLRLVLQIVGSYKIASSAYLDFVQEGNIGLIHAVRKFDPTRGFKFSTYASWWIRAYVLKYMMANTRLIVVGKTEAQRRLFYGLKSELNRHPEGPERLKKAAEALGATEAEAKEMEERLASEVRLDNPALVRNLESTLPRPDTLVEAHEMARFFEKELSAFETKLKPREVKIYRERISSDDPVTLQEFADQFGVTRERVRQIEVKIKTKLKEHMGVFSEEAA